MPATVTHYLHAVSVLSAPGGSFTQDICTPAFLLGAQGSDFLYFHRILPIVWRGKSRRDLGIKLHRIKADCLFSSFARYLAAHPNAREARSYAMGFLCHYALDSTAHPFVYAMQKALIERDHIRRNGIFVHNRIESAIDVILLNERCRERGNDFNFDKALTTDRQIIRACADIVSHAVAELTGEQLPTAVFERGFDDFRALQRFSRDPHGVKYRLIRGIERVAFLPRSLSTFVRTSAADRSFDYMNAAAGEWQNPYSPDDEPKRLTFDEIFDQSVGFATDLCRKFSRCLASGRTAVDFTKNKSYKTGMVIMAPLFDDTAAPTALPDGKETSQMNEMKRIASFCVDHTKLERGIYVSRIDGDIVTYDLRTVKPNSGNYMPTAAMHTIEHLFATYARNSADGGKVIYFGPMGCRTGFYFLVRDMSDDAVLELVRGGFRFIADYSGVIPGSSEIECGNYLEHDLDGAKMIAKSYADLLETKTVNDMNY